MRKGLKIILITVGCFFIIGIAVTVYMWNKPHRSVEDANAIKVTSGILYNSFLKDPATAKKNYINNIVEVEGVIARVSVNNLNQKVILLNTTVTNAYINCTMEGEVGNLQPDHIITVKGICNGYNSGDTDMGILGDVILIRCYKTN